MNQKLRDLAEFKDSARRIGELRIHLRYSRGGTVTARMWHPDGFKLGSAGGGGYDKRGAALGEAIQALFAEELKALPLPTRRANGSVEAGLYGLGEDKNGKRYVDGGCGLECMLKIIGALGFDYVACHDAGNDSSLVIALNTKIAVSK